MKNFKINLHMECKRALVIVLSFAMLFSTLCLFVLASISTSCANLDSLSKSSYEYSVTTEKSIGQDDYYQFNAGISFANNQNAQTSMNAEVLMQAADSIYTPAVSWNANRLSTYGVAITQGLAKIYGINEGDTLYSKHVVDGTVHEYVVEQVLPELKCARNTGNAYTDGLIIIGYDDLYCQNLAHTTLIYTDETIEDLTEIYDVAPTNILYRSDEISVIVKKLVPYILVFTVLAILLMGVLVILVAMNIKSNFRRLIILGYQKSGMDSAYSKLAYGIAVGSMLISIIISAALSQLFVFSLVEIAILLFLILAEIITLGFSVGVSKKHLWR